MAQRKSSTARIVEDVPGPNTRFKKNLVRVSAQYTPSGFQVPRYVSLKYSVSNGRSGPSKGHPVAWQYKKRGLPMIVVAETDVWRKVRDVNGDETWMNRRLLDGRRMVLARTEITLRAKPRSDSKMRAIAAKGALLELDDCDLNGWCHVQSEDGRMHGYALQNLLWGAELL
jgi:SH3-like domain-containing protein